MWLYIPPHETLPPFPFVRGPGASTWPWTLRYRAFVRSYTWRGTRSPSRLWRKRLKRVIWLQRLYGRMPEPSQAAAFVASWTSSLAASRASRGALPESVAATTTTATCGPPPADSSPRPDVGPYSSRMSAACSPAPIEFTESFDGWVSRLRADFSRRRKSDGATKGKGSSSSQSATPRDPPSLDLWPTPTERDHRSVHASDVIHARNARPLSETAGLWATPTIADTDGGRRTRSGPRKDELLLPGQVRELHHRLDPTTPPPGGKSSRSGLTLNPSFVEWLMDWPEGWTLLPLGESTAFASTGCASSGMAFCRYRRRLRSELSRFVLHPSPPAQLDLFG